MDGGKEEEKDKRRRKERVTERPEREVITVCLIADKEPCRDSSNNSERERSMFAMTIRYTGYVHWQT